MTSYRLTDDERDALLDLVETCREEEDEPIDLGDLWPEDSAWDTEMPWVRVRGAERAVEQLDPWEAGTAQEAAK